MFCQKCGTPIDDNSVKCPHCGQNIAPAKPPISSGIVILLLILFFPVGLYFMWAKSNWSKTVKIIVTVVIALFALGALGQSEPNITQDSGNSVNDSVPQTADTQVPETTLSPEEIAQAYKDSCTTSDFETLARNPDNYKGQKFMLTGEVIQVLESKKQTDLRINISANTFGDTTLYSDTVYAVWYPEENADRILEGDIITFWCECIGLISYDSIFGQKISLPGFTIAYYELAN